MCLALHTAAMAYTAMRGSEDQQVASFYSGKANSPDRVAISARAPLAIYMMAFHWTTGQVCCRLGTPALRDGAWQPRPTPSSVTQEIPLA